jgi:hypothetical protein
VSKLTLRPNDLAAGLFQINQWPTKEKHMSIETILIILVVVLLLGGGGFYIRGRR